MQEIKLKAGRQRMYAKALWAVSAKFGLDGDIVQRSQGPRWFEMQVKLDDPTQVKKALSIGDELATATNTKVCIASRKGGYVIYQLELAPGFWQTVRWSELENGPGRAVIGMAEGGRAVEFKLSPPHVGVFGATGLAGKTETLRTIARSMMGAYPPDQLQLLIFDLKGKFTQFENVSHLHGWPIARTEEQFDQVMGRVNTLIKEREAASDFTNRPVLVLMDEAEAIIAKKARLQVVQALVQRGREVRVHGLFATQEPQRGKFASLLNQINNIWCGRVKDAYVSWKITGVPGLRANELSGPGDEWHVGDGMPERLQVALVDEADYRNLERGGTSEPELPDLDDEELVDPGRFVFKETSGSGRPPNDVEPEIEAHYLWLRNKITQRQAKEELGLSDYAHRQYKAHARQVLAAFERFRTERGNRL